MCSLTVTGVLQTKRVLRSTHVIKSNGTTCLRRDTSAPIVPIGCGPLATYVHVLPFTKIAKTWVQRYDIRLMPKNMTERAGGTFSQTANRIQRL